jgi:hypothetical protein
VPVAGEPRGCSRTCNAAAVVALPALVVAGSLVPLAFGGSGNDGTHLADPHPAELFDPGAGTVETVDQELAGDVFCVGHAFLADGRLLAAGGTYRYDGSFTLPLGPGDGLTLPPFRGLDQAYVFDPDDERWTRVGDLHAGRWSPTLVTLGDGSVLTAAGLTKRSPWVALRKLERFVPGRGWSVPRGIGRWLPLYPRLHLLPDGDVLYAGSYNTHYTFPFSLREFPTARLDLSSRTWTDSGPRPAVEDAPDRVRHGEPFAIGVDDADGVDEVTLVRQSSTTHRLNTDQRLVELPIVGRDVRSGTVRVRLPANPSLVPPGYHLLFVLRDGVPSRAPFVHVPRPAPAG